MLDILYVFCYYWGVENKLKLDETKFEVLVNGKPSSQKEAIKLVERSMSKWEARRKRWQAYKNDKAQS